MSELTKIASVLFKHLSDAFLSAASEISSNNSKGDTIIASLNDLEPKTVNIEVGVKVLFGVTKNKKYWATVDKIDGELLEVSNSVIRKSWSVYKAEVIATLPKEDP